MKILYLRYKKYLENQFGRPIMILADVNTKHGIPLSKQTIIESTLDLVERVMVDGIIVTVNRTGVAPNLNELNQVKKASGDVPVLVGSGVNDNNIIDLNEFADGFIIGSYFKMANKISKPVDVKRVKILIEKIR